MEDRFRLRVFKEIHSLKYCTDGIISVMDQMTIAAPLQDHSHAEGRPLNCSLRPNKNSKRTRVTMAR